ncbi:protein-glutamate O-methyltransferase CheR [candidate division WOR-3 bacterium]|nr:protein-glutamate O-methyltransferase CheR [candidate division WOR-3 bacterium]
MITYDYTGIEKLIERIKSNTGYDFSQYKEKPFKRRVRVILRKYKLISVEDLIQHLDKNKDEYQSLIKTITINVTEFFRNIEVFNQFNALLKANLKEGYKYKVLSAGCATGEEPYSIAFLFEKLKEKYYIKYKIDAIDIDRDALNKAIKGEYPLEELYSIPEDLREYVKINETSITIKNSIKTNLEFRLENLYEDNYSFGTMYDFIFCRNVFIYFSRDLQLKILNNFYSILNTGGYLILGKVETLSQNFKNKFEMIDLRNRIYRKL